MVAPQVYGYTLEKVLMDGGSSINILYFKTFQEMSLTRKQLQPSSTVFHGIVPGKSAHPLGRIHLEVAFGSTSNFRSEILPFEVVDFKSPYHALFGRPAYAKFMARPCYVYLKLKMSGPYGIITVDESREIASSCEKEDAAYVEQACAQLGLEIYKERVDPADPTLLKKLTPDSNPKFESAEDTKKVNFVSGDSSKQFIIGTGLPDK